jgi:hypothetical protein
MHKASTIYLTKRKINLVVDEFRQTIRSAGIKQNKVRGAV